MSVDQPQSRTLAPRTLEQDQILLDELADLGLDFARDLPGRRRTPEDVRILCHRAAKTFTGPAPKTPRPPRRPIPPPPRLSAPIPIRRVRTQADEPLIEARLREAGRRREQTNDS